MHILCQRSLSGQDNICTIFCRLAFGIVHHPSHVDHAQCGAQATRVPSNTRRWFRQFLVICRCLHKAGGTGVGAQKGHPGAPTNRGRSNTETKNAGATAGGTRASTAYQEEGRSKAGEATRTGNQNGGNGRACAWEAATTKGMAWPASPVATGCQGNPCSTGIRWGVSPAAHMGCLRSRSGSPPGADQP